MARHSGKCLDVLNVSTADGARMSRSCSKPLCASKLASLRMAPKSMTCGSPVVESVASAFEDKYPAPEKLYTIDDLGGWSEVNTELFDAEDGTIIKLYDEIAS